VQHAVFTRKVVLALTFLMGAMLSLAAFGCRRAAPPPAAMSSPSGAHIAPTLQRGAMLQVDARALTAASQLQFESADHERIAEYVDEKGVKSTKPVVERYEVEVYGASSDTPLKSVDIQKPPLTDGVVRVPLLPIVQGSSGPVALRVVARGPGGFARSGPSDVFDPSTESCSYVSRDPNVELLVTELPATVSRSDPTPSPIYHDSSSPALIKSIEVDLEGYGEPSLVKTFPQEVRRTGEYHRGTAVKFVREGTFPVVVTATDFQNRSTKVRCAPGIQVVP
jgi:hypothetical protein